jgi:hypothetical protein
MHVHPHIGGYCNSELGGCFFYHPGAEGSASTVAVSMAMASGIMAPSAFAPITMSTISQL